MKVMAAFRGAASIDGGARHFDSAACCATLSTLGNGEGLSALEVPTLFHGIQACVGFLLTGLRWSRSSRGMDLMVP